MNKQDKLTAFLEDTFQAEWDNFSTDLPQGLVIEFGVAGGSSFNTICRAFHPRHCYGFDWFYGLPEDWKGGCEQGAFSTNGRLPECPHNGSFVVGLVEDMLVPFLTLRSEQVAFVHFDMDLYAPTIFALQALTPRFQHGTILLFDEIACDAEAVEHAQRAFREWLDAVDFDIEGLGRFSDQAYAFRLIRP